MNKPKENIFKNIIREKLTLKLIEEEIKKYFEVDEINIKQVCEKIIDDRLDENVKEINKLRIQANKLFVEYNLLSSENIKLKKELADKRELINDLRSRIDTNKFATEFFINSTNYIDREAKRKLDKEKF